MMNDNLYRRPKSYHSYLYVLSQHWFKMMTSMSSAIYPAPTNTYCSDIECRESTVVSPIRHGLKSPGRSINILRIGCYCNEELQHYLGASFSAGSDSTKPSRTPYIRTRDGCSGSLFHQHRQRPHLDPLLVRARTGLPQMHPHPSVNYLQYLLPLPRRAGNYCLSLPTRITTYESHPSREVSTPVSSCRELTKTPASSVLPNGDSSLGLARRFWEGPHAFEPVVENKI